MGRIGKSRGMWIHWDGWRVLGRVYCDGVLGHKKKREVNLRFHGRNTVNVPLLRNTDKK